MLIIKFDLLFFSDPSIAHLTIIQYYEKIQTIKLRIEGGLKNGKKERI